MLHGNNIFGFFEDKQNTRWETADIKEYCSIFENETVPPFILVLDSFGAGTVKLFDVNTDTEQTSNAVTVVASSDSFIISSIGSVKAGLNDGYYYLKISDGVKTYYSDVFGWCTDVSNLFKLKINSANLTMGGVHNLPFSSFTYEFYLQFTGIKIDSEINEDGVEKFYGDIPAFSATSIIRDVEINGNNQIFRFLSTLRALRVNGTIEITVNGETKFGYDFISEIKDSDSFGETLIISFKYKESDFIASRNEI